MTIATVKSDACQLRKPKRLLLLGLFNRQNTCKDLVELSDIGLDIIILSKSKTLYLCLLKKGF